MSEDHLDDIDRLTRSGSDGSLTSHPRISGVNPPAILSRDGLVDVTDPDVLNTGYPPPTPAKEDENPEQNNTVDDEETADDMTNLIETSNDRFEDLGNLQWGEDIPKQARIPVIVHVLIPISFILIALLGVAASKAVTSDKGPDLEPYVTACVMFLWAALFQWIYTAAYESVRRTWYFIPKTNRGLGLLCVSGILMGVWVLATVISDGPHRRPERLTRLLATAAIIYAIVIRGAWIGKGVWGVRIVCVCGILAGHFLVLEPQLFGMEDEAGFGSAAQIIGWGFCWVLGLLCLVTAASLAEKNLEEVPAHVVCWITTSAFLTLTVFCWLDIVRHTGWAGSGGELWKHLCRTVLCFAALTEDCNVWSAILLWLLCCSCALLFPLGFLIVCKLDGTLHLLACCVFVSPLVDIFGSVISWDGSSPVWQADINYRLGFIGAGLIIILMSLILWSVLYYQECQHDLRASSPEPLPPPPPVFHDAARPPAEQTTTDMTAPLLTSL